jgi:hypothetical protein
MLSPSVPKISLALRAMLRRALTFNAPLTVVGLLMLITFAGTVIGLIVDPTVITGVPSWLKPAKFSLSFAIYAFTLLWFLSFVKGHRRLVALTAIGTAIGVVVVMTVIAVQVIRDTTSHYNDSTPLNSLLFNLMGSFITVIMLMALLVVILLLRQHLPDQAWAWSLRLGLVLTLVGMAMGAAMIVPGAHSVGVADGGPGVPILGWSSVGGDLRVAHFIGLHSFQILPLVGWLLVTHAKRLSSAHRVGIVWVVGMSYLGLMLLLFWQALRGQSAVAPDALSLMAFGLLITSGALLTSAIIAHARRQNCATTEAALQKES